MTILERHRHILNKLQEAGFVRVADLSQELNVSAVTIRKDLKELEARNLLHRSHGSASLRAFYVNDRPVGEKENLYASEKLRIAHAAVQRLRPDDAIIIGSGTTALALARLIPVESRLRVLTSALHVSTALLHHEQVEVVQLGGIVRRSSASTVGPYTEQMIRDFACTKLFLGVDGITLDYGLTTANLMEAHLNRLMIRAAQQTIVMADASKFGCKGFGKICTVEEVDVILTDEGISAATVGELEARGVTAEVV